MNTFWIVVLGAIYIYLVYNTMRGGLIATSFNPIRSEQRRRGCIWTG